MNLMEAMEMIDRVRPFAEQSWDPATHQPQYVDQSQEHYDLYKVQSPTYGIAGYISPYPSNNWNTSSGVLSFVEDESRLPTLDHRIDPNRIFISDIAALRALAADQNKITKMFEKKLVESLTDKGKFGLTEDDVEAMQALTAARSAIATINRDQITIKKHIADLKIKQQQLGNGSGNNNNSMGGGATVDGMDIGRSIMDRIFEIPGQTTPTVQYETPVTSLDDVSNLLDNLVPTVNEATVYEPLKPKTYVIAGDTDDDVEYATYGSDGQLISDYPNPTAKITSIDRTNDTATDEFMTTYHIKYKNEM